MTPLPNYSGSFVRRASTWSSPTRIAPTQHIFSFEALAPSTLLIAPFCTFNSISHTSTHTTAHWRCAHRHQRDWQLKTRQQKVIIHFRTVRCTTNPLRSVLILVLPYERRLNRMRSICSGVYGKTAAPQLRRTETRTVVVFCTYTHRNKTHPVVLEHTHANANNASANRPSHIYVANVCIASDIVSSQSLSMGVWVCVNCCDMCVMLVSKRISSHPRRSTMQRQRVQTVNVPSAKLGFSVPSHTKISCRCRRRHNSVQ